ncbi:alpha/beta fold hydrolase [Streptomyces minutiscleroticus]|uniref:Hydrolase n=1 Tax=Streptomyces minutiscleroticus TaxID=68238 RepID=A0A918NTZ4_9ACTN|nr:hypothetical protein [Streptomyces minutiscleroticus]GGX96398.1 hypothetical protein GCM10010358_57730 [Streptomyces minutiscleroticus]
MRPHRGPPHARFRAAAPTGARRCAHPLTRGESDRIVTPAYGAAYADALGRGRPEIVPEAGHLPQTEQPEATFALIDTDLRETGAGSSRTL